MQADLNDPIAIIREKVEELVTPLDKLSEVDGEAFCAVTYLRWYLGNLHVIFDTDGEFAFCHKIVHDIATMLDMTNEYADIPPALEDTFTLAAMRAEALRELLRRGVDLL